jgi:hypothetical protein
MRIENESPYEWGDDVMETMQSMYAPPAHESYWGGLERRIMERITHGAASGAAEWWAVFGGWTRFGLAAAGIAAVIVTAATMRTREAEARVAYEAVIEPPESTFTELATHAVPYGAAHRDPTFRTIFPN